MSEFQAVNPPSLGASIAPFPQGLVAGGFVFISGQVALDQSNDLVGEGDIAEQTRCIGDRLRSILGECGAGLDSIVSATVFVKSADLFAAFNEAWTTVFGENPPARATVVTDFVVPGVLIEVQATAYVGDGAGAPT